MAVHIIDADANISGGFASCASNGKIEFGKVQSPLRAFTNLSSNADLDTLLGELDSFVGKGSDTATALGNNDLPHMGTFTGSTISDNTTCKVALQELETALERDHDALGNGANAHMGTFTGTTISDNVSTKVALQELETAVEATTTPSLDQVCAVGNTTPTDIEITDATKGVIIREPGLTRYRVTINNRGALVTTVVV